MFIRWLSLILLLLLSPAYAADSTVAAMTAASALSGAELLYCVQGGADRKCTATQATTYTYSLASGDCTATSGGAFTCTKTNGVSFGTLATLSSINNSNWSGAVLSIANGGNGTGSPGLTAGTGITLGSSWPTQSVALTIPVVISSGGTNATTASTAFNNLSPMTTIGDIIYGGASGTGTRLANGTSGQFLSAVTGAAPAWATPPIYIGRPDYSTSRWYTPLGSSGASTAGAIPTGSVIRCMAGSIGQKMTLGSIGVNITSLSAGGFIQVAIYSSANGLPNALIGGHTGGAGTGISTAATGFVNAALTANKQVGPGGSDGDSALWWCTNQDNNVAVTSASSVVPSNSIALVGSAAGASNYNLSTSVPGLTCSGANCNGGSSTFGTWPASLAGSTWTEPTTRIVPQPSFQPTSIP